MKYYLSAEFVFRSISLKELFEDIDDFDIQTEPCSYKFSLPEDLFYKINISKENQEEDEQNIYQNDLELAGGRLETKLEKDEDANSLISWEFKSERLFTEFGDLEEFEEFCARFPEISIGFCDEVSCGFPEPEENDKMLTIHITDDMICEDCGGFVSDEE